MNRASKRELWFTAVLVGVPALVNTLNVGSYVVEPFGTFWIGPMGTTLPFVFLALLFVAHNRRCERRQTMRGGASSSKSAYWGAGAAWLAMLGLTQFLLSQPPGPQASSSLGIAVLLTPMCYLPLLTLGYIAGALASKMMNDRRKRNWQRDI